MNLHAPDPMPEPTPPEPTRHSEAQALAKLRTIHHSILALDALEAGARRAEAGGETFEDADEIRERLHEIPLSAEYRTDWYALDEEPDELYERLVEPTEARLLLCAGGPAVQLHCRLHDDGSREPTLQHRDWFEAWEDLTAAAIVAADLDPVACQRSLMRFTRLCSTFADD